MAESQEIAVKQSPKIEGNPVPPQPPEQPGSPFQGVYAQPIPEQPRTPGPAKKPEPEPEQAEEQEAETTEPEKPTGHDAQAGWDKALQQLQQVQAQMARDFKSLSDMRAGAEPGAQPTAQEQQKIAEAIKRVEKGQAKLERLQEITDVDLDEVKPADFNKAVRHQNSFAGMIETLRDQVSDLSSQVADAVGKLEENQTQSLKRTKAELEEARARDHVETNWNVQHPKLAGQFQSLLDQAAEAVQSRRPDLTGDLYSGYVAREFETLVEQAEAKPEPAGPKKATPPAPPSKKPPTSTAGTRTAPQGAAPAATAATAVVGPSDADPFVGLWTPDDQPPL